MSQENRLSTVLLLIALGLLIYYLSCSKSSENFDNDAMMTSQLTPVQEKIAQNFPNQPATPFLDPERDRLNSNNVPANVNESDLLFEDNNFKSAAPTTSATNSNNDLFNYGPSDLGNTGATLDEAFERPIPVDAQPDAVDINKNNVINYDAKDFLPQEINNKWFDTDFSQAKHNLNDDKLINANRFVIGINSVGQSLKNASYDIRGTIANPKFTVSPWNNSTYEPDYNIKALC